MQKVLLGLPT